MKNLLNQLYDGKIYPAEQYTPQIEEYRRLWKEHYQHREKFMGQLRKMDPPLDREFIEIMDEQLDAVPLELSEMFIDGFFLGVRLMTEVYQRDIDNRHGR